MSSGKYVMHVQDKNKVTINTIARYRSCNRGHLGWSLGKFRLPLENEGTVYRKDRNFALQHATYGTLRHCWKSRHFMLKSWTQFLIYYIVYVKYICWIFWQFKDHHIFKLSKRDHYRATVPQLKLSRDNFSKEISLHLNWGFMQHFCEFESRNIKIIEL